MYPIIKVANVSKNYNKKLIIDNVSFSVHHSSITGILGPNGSGKTTLLKMLTGLEIPDSGIIEIAGEPLKEKRKSITRIGAIIELPAFYLSLSAEENLYNLSILSPSVKEKCIQNRITEVLDVVGLLKHKNIKVKNFSLGMKQRLGIAQALITDPDILILDEPTNGLDVIGLSELKDLIKFYAHKRNKSFIISSHMIAELEDIFTDLIIINKGRIIWQGKKSDIKIDNRHSLEEFFIKVIRNVNSVSEV